MQHEVWDFTREKQCKKAPLKCNRMKTNFKSTKNPWVIPQGRAALVELKAHNPQH